jgi:diguanylate cyclase (GGDEF)-like protein
MVLKLSFPIFLIYALTSSLVMEKAVNDLLLFFSAMLLLLLVSMDKPNNYFRVTQFAALALFHWTSQLNWCFALYLILIAKESFANSRLSRSILLSITYVGVYTAIRFTYTPVTTYSTLVVGSDVIGFIVAVFVVHYLGHTKREKELLNRQKMFLSTYDPLTGLYNYETYHKQLDYLIHSKFPFILIHIDCTDLKSMNSKQGFEEGNLVLKNIAEILNANFADAYMVSRYGGDEFALALKVGDKDITMQRLDDLLISQFPNLLGIQVTYGYATYPGDTIIKEELVSKAESKLFSMKRQIWLKREEHLLRSEKLKVIGELAAGMAHEIRNPLTTIKGFLQISKNHQYNIEPWYDLIQDEITRMNELTVEFLQFSKPHITQLKKYAIQDCVERAVFLIQSKSVLQGHEIYYNQTGPLLYSWIEKDKMVQVLLNLLQNALDAMMEKGDVTIQIYSEEEFAVIEVQDTGQGISEVEMERIFHPFYTTKEHGVGLGLSICHKIIQDFNGMLTVESEKGIGTVFKVYLPLDR